jgi:hypothetical protein
VIVTLVDISGTVNHHCLSFLFIKNILISDNTSTYINSELDL